MADQATPEGMIRCYFKRDAQIGVHRGDVVYDPVSQRAILRAGADGSVLPVEIFPGHLDVVKQLRDGASLLEVDIEAFNSVFELDAKYWAFREMATEAESKMRDMKGRASRIAYDGLFKSALEKTA